MGKVSRAAQEQARYERDLRREIKKISEQVAEEYWKKLVAIMLIVLHDKYEFDKERTAEFNKHFNAYLGMVNNGELKMHDILDTLKKEYGIIINLTMDI